MPKKKKLFELRKFKVWRSEGQLYHNHQYNDWSKRIFVGEPPYNVKESAACLMINALISWSSGLDLSPGRGHFVVFMGKTLSSDTASLHPGVQISIGKFNAGCFVLQNVVWASAWWATWLICRPFLPHHHHHHLLATFKLNYNVNNYVRARRPPRNHQAYRGGHLG